MAGGKHLSDAAENHDSDRVVGLGTQERVVELDEEAAILRVARLRTVQHDPCDPALVDGLVGDELGVDHDDLLRRLERARSAARW